MGPRHARVLEADLDGEILNIRASRLYDFTRRNTDVVQLLTRYWIGDACGQTMMKRSQAASSVENLFRLDTTIFSYLL